MNRSQKLLKMVESLRLKESSRNDLEHEWGQEYESDSPCPKCGNFRKINTIDRETGESFVMCLKCGYREYLDDDGNFVA